MDRRFRITLVWGLLLCATFEASAQAHPPLFSRDAIVPNLLRAPVEKVTNVGSTSIVFRLDFAKGQSAAFKPKTRDRYSIYSAELASYSIARSLNLDNVPPVVQRTIARKDIRTHLAEKDVKDWNDLNAVLAWSGKDEVTGAAIYWVPNLKDNGFDTTRGIKTWVSWLEQGGTIPADKISLARDMSNLIVFDYVVGNWDRFSGGNLNSDASGHRIVLRDHNNTFNVPFPLKLHQRVLHSLTRVEKFSKDLIARLQVMDAGTLKDSGLSQKQIDDVLDRKVAVLSRIAALCDVHGVDRVFSFD